MAHQYSTRVLNAKLGAFPSTTGASPKLQLWNDGGSGRPANPAASATGTKIAEGTLPSTWLGTAASNLQSKAGTWTVTGLSAAGTGTNATYARIVDSGGTNCDFQCAVHTEGASWATSHAYALNDVVYAGGNVYICTTAGTSASSGNGPTGTGTGISDGTAVWSYVSDIGIGLENVNVSNGQTVTISQFDRSESNA